MKRLIILTHRYVGIPMSVVFVIWFVSGVVMMYTGGMPAQSEAERLQGLGTVDLASVRLGPAEAARRALIDGPVSEAVLRNLLGRPAYRFSTGFGRARTVFADTGERFEGATLQEARRAIARFVGQPAERVSYVRTLTEADQWTLTEARNLPLEQFDVDDGRGTRVYFSLSSGEVALVTDRGSRALAWLGAIPHWFYFTPLRTNQPVWYWSVVWASVIGCVMAVLGLVLAITQFRRSKPFRLSASVRYRGWMKWHYYTGALFGLFALTWVFSGLLSMEPFGWQTTAGLRFPRAGLEGGPIELGQFDLTDPRFAAALASDPVSSIELSHMQGAPFFEARHVGPAGAVTRRIVDARTFELRSEPFSAESILAVVEEAAADTPIRESAILDEYDNYYYSQGGAAPLPVLRVKFDDPADTWYYFDLATSRTVAANHRLDRLERWLFNGLHSLDFAFWYNRRPFWDIGMIVLSLGALATSSIGLYLGVRRIASSVRRRRAI